MSFKKSSSFLILTAFFSGLIFGLGLIVAQMTNPAKVIGFLDVAGHWDPSLAFVIIGALVTLSSLQFLIKKSCRYNASKTESAKPLHSKVDAKLIIGSSIFGIGWGLSGLCPGPALVSLTSGLTGTFVFVGAMFTGFVVFKVLHQPK